MLALVDANSFYARCEQAFRPDLDGKPVAVLSNTDGCIVARNAEAKALGVPDLEPYFMHKKFLKQHGVVMFSSNYELYGDMSRRMMDILGSMVGDLEVYSIDEAFLQLLPTTKDLKVFGVHLKETIRQCLGLPVCVGIAPTKTLAKMANKAAKKISALGGVCVMDTQLKREWVLKRFKTRDIWGVGQWISERLGLMGIHTAYELSQASPKQLRKHFSVVMERTIRELNGEPCLTLDQEPAPKQQIICSRSFSHKIFDKVELQQALSKYAESAGEKLREQDGLTNLMLVFVEVMRSGIRSGFQQVVKLEMHTNDSRVLAKAAMDAAGELFRPGQPHHKAGIMLLELKHRQPEQLHLFTPQQSERSRIVMAALDAVNRRYGNGTMHLASQGIRPGWTLARNLKSPNWTTHWNELPQVSC